VDRVFLAEISIHAEVNMNLTSHCACSCARLIELQQLRARARAGMTKFSFARAVDLARGCSKHFKKSRKNSRNKSLHLSGK
jgi:hypothetical protein